MLGLERTFYASGCRDPKAVTSDHKLEIASLPTPTEPDIRSPAGADRYLSALNPQQRLAVEHGVGPAGTKGQGPLLVIAGAGSGKTNTLAHRVAHLVFSGADPQRILLLTFSRRAAAEMERRAGQVLSRGIGAGTSQRPPALPWSGTFHSIGARLLREYAERIGLNPSFTIHDRGDSEDLLAIVRHELGLSATKNRFPGKGTCLAIYSRAINSGAALSEVLAASFPWCAQWEAELNKLFAAYAAEKGVQNALDYDDLLLYWAHMVAEPALGREIGARFDHVLVDEYQDTNRLQASILLGIKPDGAGLAVVGDDAQSIYSFRAATVRNILDFPHAFDPPARIVTLDRNYRSTQPILDASNAVIALASERYSKNLWTERMAVAEAAADQRSRRSRSGALRRRPGPRAPRVRNDAQIAGGAVPQLQPQCAARARAGPARHSVRQVRRAQISRCGARQGCPVRAALGRQSAQQDVRLSHRAPAARAWVRRPRRSCSMRWKPRPIR